MKILSIFDLKKKEVNRKKMFIIHNPVAWRNKFVIRGEKFIKNFLNKHNIEYDYRKTTESGEATLLAKEGVERGYKLIVAIGGDGTINEVVNGIINSDAILGIVPMGTINILSMELGIPQNLSKALQTLLTGKIKSIDVGKVNDRYFLLMAGFGMDSYTIYRTNLKLKKYIGGLAYVISGLYTTFKYKPHKIFVDIDDGRIIDDGYFLVVENFSSYGGKFKIAPYADENDGLLDICLFKKFGFFHTLRYFLGIALKRHINYPDVRYYQGKKIKLHSNSNVLFHTDGDLAGSLPAEITILPKKLKIIAP